MFLFSLLPDSDVDGEEGWKDTEDDGTNETMALFPDAVVLVAPVDVVKVDPILVLAPGVLI